MTHKFLPHTDADIKAMLDTIGASNMEELYTEVPEALKLNRPVDLPPAMSEEEVRRHFEELGRKNSPLVCFAGDGVYDHYTPSVVAALTSRSEFQTSYTPYQAEISQGTLQYIFEFQTMMAELTGMDVSNASMYDGATATAEAMLMSVAASKNATACSSHLHFRHACGALSRLMHTTMASASTQLPKKRHYGPQ